MQSYLEVFIDNLKVGEITLLANERNLFVFEDDYLAMEDKPILSQSFFDKSGEIIAQTKIVQTKLPPFFSNLLPEGHLRQYLAQQGGINQQSEFKLIELLGEDLPGNVVVKSGNTVDSEVKRESKNLNQDDQIYRFSLAGIQLKFSAIIESSGGLTIPTSGLGGDWIVKLPAQNFVSVPENEFSMLQLAKEIGISTPEIDLIDLDKVSGLPELGILGGDKALAVKRFDRENGKRIHIEDFAQVYSVFPKEKEMYKISLSSFSKLAKKAQLPEYLVVNTAKETATSVLEVWNKNKYNYPLSDSIITGIDQHISKLKLFE